MNPLATHTKTLGQPHKNCHTCLFVSFCVTSSNTETTLPLIVKRQQLLKRHHTLCYENSTFNSLYIVKNGVLKAYELNINGVERITTFYLPGEIVGFEAIHNKSFPFSIAALQETVICEVPFVSLLQLIKQNDALLQHLIGLTSHRIMLNHYVTYVRAEQRLSGFLLDLATRLHCQNTPIEFVLPMTYQAIADHLSLAAETVIRLMKRFTQQKLIAIANKKISLQNIAGLKQLLLY